MLVQGLAPMLPDFNPRSPCGERPVIYRVDRRGAYFNPRSPCGERPAFRGLIVYLKEISIHAPRVGSDSGNSQ